MTSHAERIRDRLVLVRLRISSWTGKVASKQAARSAEEIHHAERGEVFAKIYQISNTYTGQIEKITRGLYRWFHESALPWGEGGWRIMRVESFLEAADHVREAQDEISACARDIFGRPETYAAIKADSKQRLGSLYDEATFPTPDELIERYGATLLKDVVTNTEDVRLAGLSDTDLEEFRHSIEDELTSSLDGAMIELVARLRELVAGFMDKIETVNSNPNRQPRFGKILAAMRDSIEILRRLNLTANPKIADAITTVETTLANRNADALNWEKPERKKAHREGKSILSAIDKLMA
jgi:hypothetical protein